MLRAEDQDRRSLILQKQPSWTTNASEFCGLSSKDLAVNHDPNHRRGRRHICHGVSKGGALTPSTPSVVSENISEGSADCHLGHRKKVTDSRLTELKEKMQGLNMVEPVGGSSSAHIGKKGCLGSGKRHFDGSEYKWVGYHKCERIDMPGGEDVFSMKKGSFLGPAKKHAPNGGKSAAKSYDFLKGPPPGEVVVERSSKRMFVNKFEQPCCATEDVPLGSSRQIDLHTDGFLGKSKGAATGGMQAVSSDPVGDYSSTPRDLHDIACYGLEHRGKRKFLVQNSLDASCRHTGREIKPGREMRSASVPNLECARPPNDTPYYQDNMPEADRAIKNELEQSCRGSRCAGSAGIDNTWSTLAWTPRKADNSTAAKFIEGEDAILRITDDEHLSYEMRASLGKAKRAFGNAHNRSMLKLDYCDEADYKTSHVTDGGVRWGEGHGRKKFGVADHLGENCDGIHPFQDIFGQVLRTRRKVVPEDHMDFTHEYGGETHGAYSKEELNDEVVFMDPNGNVLKPRPRHDVKDSVKELNYDENVSEDSNTLGVCGTRRKQEALRPVSARRFPQNDFERVTPRSVTPRPSKSSCSIPLAERPKWKNFKK